MHIDFIFKGLKLTPDSRHLLTDTFTNFLNTKIELSYPLSHYPVRGYMVEENFHPISVQSIDYRDFHHKANYLELIAILKESGIMWVEIGVNNEENWWLASLGVSHIGTSKLSFEQIKNIYDDNKGYARDYFYYMSDDKFQKQNIFRSQLIRTMVTIKPLDSYFNNSDLYFSTDCGQGYIVQERDFSSFMRELGYFRYIKIKDIDQRIIAELRRTNEYEIEEDGEWYFILKKSLQ